MENVRYGDKLMNVPSEAWLEIMASKAMKPEVSPNSTFALMRSKRVTVMICRR